MGTIKLSIIPLVPLEGGMSEGGCECGRVRVWEGCEYGRGESSQCMSIYSVPGAKGGEGEQREQRGVKGSEGE